MAANTTRRFNRSRWAAIGAAVAVTLGGGGLIGVNAAGNTSQSAGFTAVDPTRVLDTRGDTKPSGNTTYLDITGPITLASGAIATVVPDGADTVSLNLTVTEGIRNQGYGFVTAYPCTSAAAAVPNASSINFVEGVDVANGLNVPLGSTGGICLYVYGSAHLIVDVNGYFAEIDAYTRDEIRYNLNRRTAPTGVITIDSGTANAEVGQTTAVVHRNDGTPFIAYGREDDYALMGASCADPACTETVIMGELISTQGRILALDIALSADGNPIMVYVAEDTSETHIFACSDPDCLFGFAGSVSESNPTSDPSIAVHPDGRVVIAHTTIDGAFVVVCEDDLCINSTSEQLTFAPSRGTNIMIGPKGYPYVAFTADGGAGDTLTIAVCDDPDDLCANPTVTFANANILDVNSPVIMTSATGLPVIAYVDSVTRTFNVAICKTIRCDSGTYAPQALGPITDRGNAELAIIAGPNGSPTTFIYDDDELQLQGCADAECIRDEELVVLSDGDQVVPGGRLGLGISASVGLDGVPFIAYHDGVTGLVTQRLFWMAGSN